MNLIGTFFRNHLIFIVFVASLLGSLYTMSLHLNAPLTEWHGFRQAQTAIAAKSIIEGSPALNYETPVFGPPWSQPFEFPAYQYVVAKVTVFLGTDLVFTGRIINVFAFLIFVLILFAILVEFKIQRQLIYLTMIGVLSSPTYLFWSRSFLIETFALLFSAAFVLMILKWLSRPNFLFWIGIVFFGALAATVKITTFFVFAIIGFVLILRGQLFSDFKQKKIQFLFSVVAGILVILSLVLWTRYADYIKMLNHLAAGNTSSALMNWNFGSFSLRFEYKVWRSYWEWITYTVGHKYFLEILILGLAFGRARANGFIGLTLFLGYLPFLVFTNIQYRHSYYIYACGFFFILAEALCIYNLFHSRFDSKFLIRLQRGLAVFFAIFLVIAPWDFYQKHLVSRINSATIPWNREIDFVQQNSTEKSMITVMGLDWSSEFPFYSNRKAFMVTFDPDSNVENTLKVYQQMKTYGYHFGPLIICTPESRAAPFSKIMVEMGFVPQISFSGNECDVYEHKEKL